ncbi:MAG: GNAT family N-acetyltransferase [Candidatus Aminicenantes bacterium]|nr:GNAT family N-acetyltransferase [Candidatus Aminicenantes bacterium]
MPEWYDLFQDGPGERIRIYRFSMASGKTALFPVLARRVNRFETECSSGPAGVYGGWLSDAPLDDGEAEALADRVCSELPFYIWRLNPYERWQATQSGGDEADFTQALRLDRPWSEIERGMSDTRKWEARKALREGVVVRLAAGERDWEDYYSCYLDSGARWGADESRLLSRDFFRRLEGRSGAKLQLWLAAREGEVAAGALLLFHNRHVVYWHGASHRRHLAAHPASLLQYSLLRLAWGKKLLWYDFNPSAGLVGVVFFKASFGAEKMAARVWRRRANLPIGQRLLRRVLHLIRR